MSGAATWALMLGAFAVSGLALTEALAYIKPELTTRQRWAVVFWLFSAISAFSVAWRIGS